MPLIGTLTDDFEAGSIDVVKWPGNYGGVAQTGGRGRIDCDVSQYSGWKSATAYTLTGSMCGGQFFPPSASGATSTAYMSIFVTTTTAGTDAGFNIDVQSGFMGVLLRAGFSDAGAVFLAYNPTDHAWLRVREDSGSLLWEASPDGADWTTLRTATTPGWVSDPNLALLIECKRVDGVDNYGEIDNINLYATAPEEHSGNVAYGLALTPTGSGRKQAAGTASTGLALAVAAAGRKHAAGVSDLTLTADVTGLGRKRTGGVVATELTVTVSGAGAVVVETETIAARGSVRVPATSTVHVPARSEVRIR